MARDLHKRVELLANVAIVVVAVILGVVMVQRYLLAGNDAKPAPPPKPSVEAGTKIALPDVDWAKNDKTLLLVLQKDCRFCTESAPFYQRLVREASEKKVELIAVLPQSLPESRQYLGEIGVSIPDVRQSTLGAVSVRGTPTLMFVDGKGEVSKAWVGKLSPAEEAEVLAQL